MNIFSNFAGICGTVLTKEQTVLKYNFYINYLEND